MQPRQPIETHEILILRGHGVGVGPFTAVPGRPIQALESRLPALDGVLGPQQVHPVSKLVNHDVLVVPSIAPAREARVRHRCQTASRPDRMTYTQTDRQTDMETDSRPERMTDTLTDRQPSRQNDRYTNRLPVVQRE